MIDIANLDVFLHEKKIGSITNLPGDRNLFTFEKQYIDDMQRPTLSLSFKDNFRELITEVKSTRTSLPPFFSNLLPEGPMRDYLASRAKVNPNREFLLLEALGEDLPGALKIIPTSSNNNKQLSNKKIVLPISKESTMRFSLAGVQFKFSANWENHNRLTIPVNGTGGAWIAKLPSTVYHKVPENEYVMMELARNIGIDVPETALIPIEQIKGIPEGIGEFESHAFVIKRFDRDSEGLGIHMEDFAQVFGVYPDKKYSRANYKNIAEVILTEVGEEGIIEFVRRFIFNALIGNGDMHLKNWSLIYPDKVNPVLAPAYDFVSTIPYIPDDKLALNFLDSKLFSSLSMEQMKRFAAKAGLQESIVLDTSKETVEAFKKIWLSIHDFNLDKKIVNVISNHLKTIPLYEFK